MIKVKTKTLSLLYHPIEDRMKLIINKEEDDRIEFWVTRRFYFSLLFELDTMLEGLQITPPPFRKKNEHEKLPKKDKKSKNATAVKKKSGEPKTADTAKPKELKREGALLENINIRFSQKSKEFVFLFKSDKVEAESVLKQEQFLDFYNILKSTFPKGEWGMM